MKDKYTAEVYLTNVRSEAGEEVVLRFVNLTFTEAKFFMRVFDKFDHVYSNLELNTHRWEKV